MSLNWDFKKDFYGVMIRKQKWSNETIVYNYNLYDGNALMIALFETKDTYQLQNFFLDKNHMKNCLGLSKGYENIFVDNEITLILKPSSKSAKIIAEGFIKAKFEKSLKIVFKEEVEQVDSTVPFDI